MKIRTIISALGVLLAGTFAGAQETELNALRNAFREAAAVSYAPDRETTERFIEYSDHGSANDVLLLQLYMSVHLPDAEVERLLGSFEDGRWVDIDYADKTRGRWNPTLHITRMYALAKLYCSPGNKYYKNPEISALLHAGIAFWYKERPICPNWWHNDIGVPKKLTSVLLMIHDELTPEEIEGGLKVLERSKFGRTGQNKVWLAGNNLMKGLLIGDEALVLKAKDTMAEEIAVSEGEGIQPDWSFHQHGPQIQFGNYGLAYAEGLTFWARVLAGTKYAFTEEQYGILEKMMTEGICWSVWKGAMDPSFCGRQVFINALRGKAFSLAVAELNMAATGRPEAETFRNMARENLQPGKYANTLIGARYFDRSDAGIYRAKKWYGSVRMHSERTIGYEFTNRENLNAQFSADGALLVMQDGDEYDNIFAIWDWRKVPGVTAYEDGLPLSTDDSREAKANPTAHVGGAVHGNRIMAASIEVDRFGLHALKTSFFFPDLIVCLGADIRAGREEITRITTALDQNWLDGEVRSGKGWAWHDNRGYVSLDGKPLVVTAEEQTGYWDPIDPFFKGKSDSGKVFKCWIDQAGSPSYAYAVLPQKNARKTARFAAEPKVEILSNTPEYQAVRYKGVTCEVFHDGDRPRFIFSD